MKVIHIESGLGNQMLSYCEYLAMKQVNPNDCCYIETIIYEISECNEVICQWNGYELERIFGIKVPNIRELFCEDEWSEIINEIRESRFWEKNWNYPVYFTKVLKAHGLNLVNKRGDFEAPGTILHGKEKKSLVSFLKKTRVGYWLKKGMDYINRNKILEQYDRRKEIFLDTDENIFTGQQLAFLFKGNDIEKIENEIKRTFVFTPFIDEKNCEMLKIIQSTQSVAIHARRGDMLGRNFSYYQYGYFRRAVKYVKNRVKSPVFIFFCDSGSIEWCKKNAHIFGVNYDKDKVYFTDWNQGEESYRDLQLMSQCKHQIITNSSFGWWGAYLNKNPNKITISPEIFINTTVNM